MKKTRPLLAALLSAAVLAFGAAQAGADALPDDTPGPSPGARWIEEIRGVTFAVRDARQEAQTIVIDVTQSPGDGDTSLVDNQVDPSHDDGDLLARGIEQATPYGKTILGTLCDVLGATDEGGNNLLHEYRVSVERDGPGLIHRFCIFLPEGCAAREARVELVFGVNENLSARFDQTAACTCVVALTP